MKHVQTTKAGTLHYRRKIPKELQARIGKTEFKRLLGSTEREALKNYPAVNAEFERLIEAARKPDSACQFAGLTPSQRHREAERIARELALGEVHIGGQVLRADDPEAADLLRDLFLQSYRQDPETGEPVGVPETEGIAYSILASGGRLRRPAPTLEDAKRLYLQDKVLGDINEQPKRLRVERVIGLLSAAGVESTRTLASLTRHDARELRDHLLRDLNMKPATARRYINDVRALVGHGILESDLKGAVDNPFQKLTVQMEQAARDERSPFTAKLLAAVRERISGHADAVLWQIWRMVEGTGCRLGEVTGLLTNDLFLDEAIPHLKLVNHPHRRLKTKGSVREVPLIGEALAAAQEAQNAAGDSPFLFARYGHKRGADAASQVLMKHVRTVTSDPKIVVHSLRHTMGDRLIRASVDEYDRNLLLGHSRGGMGERYNGPSARLAAAERALRAALTMNV